MPIEFSMPLNPLELSFPPLLPDSGLELRAVNTRSKLLLAYGALVGIPIAPTPGVLTVPRARLTVLTWLSSARVLLSILAAASPLEKRGGSVGRGLGLLLKNSGDGG
jgi:hypothetical protein